MARILLIDDEPDIRQALGAILTAGGHDVRLAGDGDAGLSLLKEEPADLLLIDVLMPGKEGVETILELRRGDSPPKIIAISGGGNLGAVDCLEMAKLVGADRTLTKPVSAQVLLDAVEEVLA